MASLAALFKPPPRYKHRTGGVTRIQRDSYGKAWFTWVAEVKDRDRYCCVACGKPENKKESLYHDVHHIRELSKGGRTCMSNLMTICKVCHAKRHNHLHKAGYTTGSKARNKK